MTSTQIAIPDQPSKRQIGRREASAPGRVTGRLKRALDMMVWECKRDNEACAATGLRLNALRLALQRPHVRAYYRAQMDVLRARESPRNIHRLMEIRDAADNMPAVNAIKALEQLGDADHSNSRGGSITSPGITIQIIGDARIAPHCVDMDPLATEPDGSKA